MKYLTIPLLLVVMSIGFAPVFASNWSDVTVEERQGGLSLQRGEPNISYHPDWNKGPNLPRSYNWFTSPICGLDLCGVVLVPYVKNLSVLGEVENSNFIEEGKEVLSSSKTPFDGKYYIKGRFG